jgi:hypothetical protein
MVIVCELLLVLQGFNQNDLYDQVMPISSTDNLVKDHTCAARELHQMTTTVLHVISENTFQKVQTNSKIIVNLHHDGTFTNFDQNRGDLN